jgi:hypothetical protein
MQIERRWLRMAVAGALVSCLAPMLSASEARALTLADLDAGTDFSVGPLTFSDFDVIVVGDVSLDLADYPVQALSDGFRISGPLSVLFGETATLLISYDVSATDPVIAGASLFAAGMTIGAGSQAWVGESLLDAANVPLLSLFVFDVVGVGSDPFEDGGFAPASLVHVAKTVSLESGTFAALSLIDQRFLVVPEPLPLALFTLGLAGLSFWGRRHQVRA